VKSPFVVGTSNFGSPCHWVEQHLSVIVPLCAFKEISCCKFTSSHLDHVSQGADGIKLWSGATDSAAQLNDRPPEAHDTG